jgi:hypothetical protein
VELRNADKLKSFNQGMLWDSLCDWDFNVADRPEFVVVPLLSAVF